MNLLAVAVTDSHLKWVANTVDAMPAHWRAEVVVLATSMAPSARQTAAALDGTSVQRVASASLAELCRTLEADRFDAVVLACPGPALALLHATALRSAPPRLVTVAATPGIALPVRRHAMLPRRDIDVLVTHSLTERDACRSELASIGAPTHVALAHLPTLRPVAPDTALAQRALFVSQALVPHGRDRRTQLLASLAMNVPGVVRVHLRTVGEESTAHREVHAYDRLWRELVGSGEVGPDLVEFVDGPMARSLAAASAVFTVSSTAALEALAAGIPIGIVADFGVDDHNLNSVFRDSGCLVDVAGGDLRGVGFPHEEWLRRNYFHPRELDDWTTAVADAVERAHRRRRRPSRWPHRTTWWPAAKWAVRYANRRSPSMPHEESGHDVVA